MQARNKYPHRLTISPALPHHFLYTPPTLSSPSATAASVAVFNPKFAQHIHHPHASALGYHPHEPLAHIANLVVVVEEFDVRLDQGVGIFRPENESFRVVCAGSGKKKKSKREQKGLDQA